MPAYMILDIGVTDPESYAEYVKRVPATVDRYGGRYLVRGGKVTSLSGDWQPERVIVLEFPSLASMRKWSSSPEYSEIAKIRMGAARTRAIAVEGVSTEHGPSAGS